MASITGSQANAAVKVASTWGTEVATGAGNKLVAEISQSLNAQILNARTLGSGQQMLQNATRGGIQPTVTITMDVGYRNNFDVLLAVLMGTSGAPAEVTGGQADYKHTITFNSTLNAKYVTVAYESSSTTTIVFPTCAVRSVTIRTTQIPGYLEASFELLANDISFSSATNPNATIAATTQTDTDLAAVMFDDDFWLDTRGSAALASGDQYNLTSYELTLTRPQEFVGEIKGASGNGTPRASGDFEGSLTVGVKELADHALFTAWNAETEYKSKFLVEGTQIGTGTNKSIAIYLPCMKLVQEPQYSLVENGINAVTATYTLLKPTAAPTGMASAYPYFEITNGLATSLLA